MAEELDRTGKTDRSAEGSGGFMNSYHPYAIVTIVCWSLAYVLTRLALRHFTALPIGFMRYAVASLALLYVVIKFRIPPPRIADLPLFLLCGASGYFIYVTTFNVGSVTTSAATSSIVISTAPIMTAFLARFVYKEKLRRVQWFAIAVEFVGILILTAMRGGLIANRGLLWLLLAALSFCVYNLAQRKLVKRYTALQASTYSIFAGTIMLMAFMPQAMVELWHAPVVAVVYVVVMGLFSSALAYVSWSKAMERAHGVAAVSNYMFATPFLTAVLGFLMAGEVPDLSTIIGGGVIMAGLLLFYFGPVWLPSEGRR